MKKAEMRDHWDRYTALVNESHQAEKRHGFSRAVELGERSWEHLDGALRFVKKDEIAMPEVIGIRIVLRYAPVLFDAEVLDRLELFCVENRRILKSSGYSFEAEVSAARQVMWRARMLWSELERAHHHSTATLRHHYASHDEEWHHVIRTWTLMDAVVHLSGKGVPHLALATQLDASVTGKCPKCGVAVSQTKAQLLEPTKCPKCKVTDVFVEIV